jgi:hypothetical protein
MDRENMYNSKHPLLKLLSLDLAHYNRVLANSFGSIEAAIVYEVIDAISNKKPTYYAHLINDYTNLDGFIKIPFKVIEEYFGIKVKEQVDAIRLLHDLKVIIHKEVDNVELFKLNNDTKPLEECVNKYYTNKG